MNTQRFQTLQRQAPLLQGGHPVAYTSTPQNSILNPYNNNTYNFPEIKMEYGQFIHLGGGFYATKHTENEIDEKTGQLKKQEFSIGVRIFKN